MQTFLPYPDFTLSARSLDGRRLNKQRVECKQIAMVLSHMTHAWKNHPAVRMWRGHGVSMCTYWHEIHRECSGRGYADNIGWDEEIRFFLEEFFDQPDPPSWLGDERVHLSHQSNLVRKDPGYYGVQFPNVELDLPYHWPSPPLHAS